MLLFNLAIGTSGAKAGDFALECSTVGAGIRSVLLSAPGGVTLTPRELSATTLAFEIGSESLPGLHAGELPCEAARSVRVVPGTAMGTPYSRVLVSWSGAAPRVVATPGRIRLLWVSEGPRSQPVAARQPAAVPREQPAEPEAPEPEPPPRAEARPEARGGSSPTNTQPPVAVPAVPRGSASNAELPLPVYTPIEIPPGPPPPPPAPLLRSEAPPRDFLPLPMPMAMRAVVATELRVGAGQRYAVARKLAKGDGVIADGRAGDWLRIGSEGWVFSAYLATTGDASGTASGKARITAVTTPVHAGPGGQFEVVTELYQGQDVVLDEVSGDWAHVRNGGWIRRASVRMASQGKQD